MGNSYPYDVLCSGEFQIRLNVERLTITVERKNAMRCVGKDNAVRERMQCGDFIGAPHCVFGEVMNGERWMMNDER